MGCCRYSYYRIGYVVFPRILSHPIPPVCLWAAVFGYGQVQQPIITNRFWKYFQLSATRLYPTRLSEKQRKYLAVSSAVSTFFTKPRFAKSRGCSLNRCQGPPDWREYLQFYIVHPDAVCDMSSSVVCVGQRCVTCHNASNSPIRVRLLESVPFTLRHRHDLSSWLNFQCTQEWWLCRLYEYLC